MIVKPKIKCTREKTDFGYIWHFHSEHKTLHFDIYMFNDDTEAIYLSNVFVKKEYRGCGLGNLILEATENFAQDIRASTVCLMVDKNSFAYNWYTKHGFHFLSKDEDNENFDWLEKRLK